jgi:hypothetical protein
VPACHAGPGEAGIRHSIANIHRSDRETPWLLVEYVVPALSAG